MASSRRLYILLGSDCDPDRPHHGGASYDAPDGLRWRGVSQGVPRAREIADQVSREIGLPVRVTWCVRSDDQMARLYDDPAWPYRSQEELWKYLAAQGDEIAWHAHLWRWDESAACWYQEIEDADWAGACLSQGHSALVNAAGVPINTSRMGWEFHNDYTMQTVDALGVKQDFTAIANWYMPGESSRGSRFHCYCDWRGTPATPYHPGRADYRRPAEPGRASLSLTEIPLSTFTSGLLGGLRTVRKAFRSRGLPGITAAFSAGTWRSSASKAYVTIQPMIFRKLVAERLRAAERSSDGTGVLVTAFHPDDFLEDDSHSLYSSRHFPVNLRIIVTSAQARLVEPVFVTANELRERLAAGCYSSNSHPPDDSRPVRGSEVDR
ncbi:MAG: hypothetical protein HPY44_12835 [Armatimonadetes bacterium]|nr:hypothetical protein [Armatimonadota bacterium]